MNKTAITKQIYQQIIRKLAIPLELQITRARQYCITDFQPIFQNIHSHYTTPLQKQIIYRLLFKNTPTMIGFARQRNIIVPCPTCKHNIQETEEHLFFTCAHIKPTLDALSQLLHAQSNTHVDTYKAIFLNIIPQTNPTFHNIKLIILATFRQTIWTTRLDAKFRHKNLTPDNIKTIFIQRTINTLTKHELWASFERMTE